MLTAFLAVLPVFLLIGAGWMAGRRAWLGPTGSAELNRFVVWLGLPALLFTVMAEADWAKLWQPGFIAAFAIGGCAVLLGTVAWRLQRGESLADASLNGLNAASANTGYIGFPIAETVMGRDSFGLVSITAILTASAIFSLAIVLLEAGRHQGAHPVRLAGRVGLSVLRNPIVLAPLLGGLWSSLGIPLPDSVARALHLLGAAASPCALIALGLFFAAPRQETQSTGLGLPIQLSVIKLVLQPLLTGALVLWVFRLEPFAAAVAVLMSALPTATGAFMLADHYRLDAATTSRTILISTALSIVTLTVLAVLLQALPRG